METSPIFYTSKVIYDLIEELGKSENTGEVRKLNLSRCCFGSSRRWLKYHDTDKIETLNAD